MTRMSADRPQTTKSLRVLCVSAVNVTTKNSWRSWRLGGSVPYALLVTLLTFHAVRPLHILHRHHLRSAEELAHLRREDQRARHHLAGGAVCYYLAVAHQYYAVGQVRRQFYVVCGEHHRVPCRPQIVQ